MDNIQKINADKCTPEQIKSYAYDELQAIARLKKIVSPYIQEIKLHQQNLIMLNGALKEKEKQANIKNKKKKKK